MRCALHAHTRSHSPTRTQLPAMEALGEALEGLSGPAGAQGPPPAHSAQPVAFYAWVGTCTVQAGPPGGGGLLRVAGPKALGRADWGALLSELRALHAYVLYVGGDYAGAEALQRRVVEWQEAVLGDQHLATLASMGKVAAYLDQQGKQGDAERLFRTVMHKQLHVLGPDHPSTFPTMHNLAACLARQGSHAQAEEQQWQLLARQRRVLGDDHPDTLTSMHQLAGFMAVQGKLAASALQQHVVEQRRALLGAQHPSTIASMRQLAAQWSQQGMQAQAEELLWEVNQQQRAHGGMMD